MVPTQLSGHCDDIVLCIIAILWQCQAVKIMHVGTVFRPEVGYRLLATLGFVDLKFGPIPGKILCSVYSQLQ